MQEGSLASCGNCHPCMPYDWVQLSSSSSSPVAGADGSICWPDSKVVGWRSSDKSGPSGGSSPSPVACPNGGSMEAAANAGVLLWPAVVDAASWCCSCLSCAEDCSVRAESAALLHALLEDTAIPAPIDCMVGHGTDDALEPTSRSACDPVASASLDGA